MQKYQFVQRRSSGSVSQLDRLLFQGVFLRSKHILTTHSTINKTLQCVVRICLQCRKKRRSSSLSEVAAAKIFTYHVVVHMCTPTQAGNQAFLYIWELVSKYKNRFLLHLETNQIHVNIWAQGRFCVPHAKSLLYIQAKSVCTPTQANAQAFQYIQEGFCVTLRKTFPIYIYIYIQEGKSICVILSVPIIAHHQSSLGVVLREEVTNKTIARGNLGFHCTSVHPFCRNLH